MLLLDTSVLVALYLPEEKSRRVEKKATGKNRELAISSLAEVEFVSAISRQVRMKSIQRDQGHFLVSQFHLHLSEHVYSTFPLTRQEFETARDWIFTFDTSLRTLDALHLAVAHSNRLTLLTDDAAFAKSARQLGVPVETV